ncbi:MAG: response regulator [Flavobacteriia bacterium]|jgi:CheY-like chemotaxis protein
MENLKYAVLCVDDDPVILHLIDFQMKKLVNPVNTIVESTTDPTQVEEKLEEIKSYGLEPLFLMTDYQMPGMSGAQLIRKIKNIDPNLNCILLSGQANDMSVAQLEEENLLFSFISKPWKEDQMKEILKPLLSKAEEN